MYVVQVTVHVKAEAIDAFITASRANHEGSRQEPGNQRWDFAQDSSDPTIFYLYEVYDDEAAFKAHQQTDHYFTWRDTVADMMGERGRSATKAHALMPNPWN